LQSQHLLEDIYESFKKVNQNQNQNAEGIDKKKTTAYSNMRKIADQIRSMDKKMDENENDIEKLLI
jgi:DNA anti-recombination protein RmuC